MALKGVAETFKSAGVQGSIIAPHIESVSKAYQPIQYWPPLMLIGTRQFTLSLHSNHSLAPSLHNPLLWLKNHLE